jgi:hypothetical protein
VFAVFVVVVVGEALLEKTTDFAMAGLEVERVGEVPVRLSSTVEIATNEFERMRSEKKKKKSAKDFWL